MMSSSSLKKQASVKKQSYATVNKMDNLKAAAAAACNEDDLHCLHQRLTASLAKAETRSVSILRIAVMSALLLTAGIVSVGVFLYTKNEEQQNFTTTYEDAALQVLESFHDMVERNLGAVASLSTDYTSYALQSNSTFPMVTLPDFALRGSQFRAQSGSHIVHYLPLVKEDEREAWEEYAEENRYHIDEEFMTDSLYRSKQDEELYGHDTRRKLQQADDKKGEEEVEPEPRPMSVLDDGTGYHAKIWSNGAMVPKGDEPEGTGPYLPTWQRSPVSGQRQGFLNMNWVHAKVIGPGLLDTMMKEKRAVLRNAAVPIPAMLKLMEQNLKISQYREHVEDYIDGLSTFLAYPVFDKFGEDGELAGVLATNVYWKMLLSHLLPHSSRGIICVVENSFGQVFSYRIDGPEATFMGLGAHNDPQYDHLEFSENINDYLWRRASPRNRAYTTVSLSDTTQYTIRVFPSQDTEAMFVTNKPIVYTVVVLFGFALASVLFLLFSYVVEKRQHLMIAKVVENAERVTNTEREMNEFLAHEIRNPLSSSLSACCFVTSALNENGDDSLSDPETLQTVREDMDVVQSSLNFINDFLRSMLDIHRVAGNKIKIQKAPTDLLRDILEPVSAIVYSRVANFEVQVVCPENLIVHADPIRLKQVVLNLVRNSSKFVEHGFIRMRAEITPNQLVRLYVEDSGPGIGKDKQEDLFSKYQASLDLLSQGTGLGLHLVKRLMESMEGDIWLDHCYNSGVEGYPGACFVVELNSCPLDIESTLPNTDSESEHAKEAFADEPVTQVVELEKPPEDSAIEPPDNDDVGQSGGLFAISSSPPQVQPSPSSPQPGGLFAISSSPPPPQSSLPPPQPGGLFAIPNSTQAQTSESAPQPGSLFAIPSSSTPAQTSPSPPQAGGLFAISSASTSPAQISQSPPQPGGLFAISSPPPEQPTASAPQPTGLFAISSPSSTTPAAGKDAASCKPEATAGSAAASVTPRPPKPAPAGPVLPENLKVLMTDDDAMIRKLFVRALKKFAPSSWQISEASSGEMALRLCDEQQEAGSAFDLIFLDQYMASVDKQLLGTETAQAMRAKGIKSTICGLSANDIRDNFVSAGADDFILKPLPCKPAVLRETLHKLLQHRR